MNAGANGSAWYAGGQYKIGNATLVVQGGMTGANSTSFREKRKAESFTVGMLYDLSKRSNLFGGYQRVNLKDRNSSEDRDRDAWTLGLRHHF